MALIFAAGVLYKQGVLLNPAICAVLMTVSTIVVAINASLLKVKKILVLKAKKAALITW